MLRDDCSKQMSMNGLTKISLLFATLLLTNTALAQLAEFPTGSLDSRTMRIQSKVESLYERGDYKRAHFIYSNELAPVGDKYAQYMTGYMYLMGQGVAEDPVRASAWYRIAAERKVPEFIAVRDRLIHSLSVEDRARSDVMYVELRKRYSDLVIIMNLMVQDLEVLRAVTTGSRVSGGSSSVTIIDPRSGAPMSADHYRNRVRRAVETRLDFITTQLDINPLDGDLENTQVNELWVRIQDYVSVVDDEGDAFVAAP